MKQVYSSPFKMKYVKWIGKSQIPKKAMEMRVGRILLGRTILKGKDQVIFNPSSDYFPYLIMLPQ